MNPCFLNNKAAAKPRTLARRLALPVAPQSPSRRVAAHRAAAASRARAMQPSLASSAFARLSDELLAYWTLFLSPGDLLAMGETGSAFYVFCQEEPLWMAHCLRIYGGDFAFLRSWKLTTFFPREPRPQGVPEAFRTFSPSRGFGSDFLYRRWYRGHMALGDAFLLPPPEADPTIKRLRKFDNKQLSFRVFYEQFSKVPFIIRGAIDDWAASSEWTMEKLAERFPQDIKHRITHNLDIFSAHSTMEMSFADYCQYMRNQHDETPLYIFDARFGEKMPAMVTDYSVDSLGVFRQDFLKEAAENQAKEAAKAEAESVRFQAGGKKIQDNSGKPNAKKKKSKHGSIRPDFRWIVIGPERTGAPWHTDPARTSAWNSLIKGRKRWAIYPPGSPPPGVQIGKNGQNREHALNMTSLMWYLHVYPTLPPEQKPWEIIQEEGETIYVPSGWWHLVLNLDETIAVTQNFVDSHNVLMFAKDLLNDNEDEALQIFQHELKPSHPELYDVFRLVQIPHGHGYFSEEMYINSFKIVEYWKSPLKKIYNRHQLASLWNIQKRATGDVGDIQGDSRIPKLKSLTSRANPTFAIGKRAIVKFFSQFNEEWGEFDLESYLAPDFGGDNQDASTPRSKKQRTHEFLDTYELKKAMTLRFAMEECYRVEKSAYAMISSSKELAPLVPKFYHCGHLQHVDEVDDEDGDGPMWRWPYIVSEYKHDVVGLGAITKMGGATRQSWQQTAAWISGEFLPKLHAVPIDSELRGLHGHPKSKWDWYQHYLLRQRKRALAFHYCSNTLPSHLATTLEDFLPPPDADSIALLMLPANAQTCSPVLLHGDLTDENVLGRVVSHQQRKAAAKLSSTANESQDLRALLQSIGCEKYASILVEREELTVETLGLLDDAALKGLGLPLGPRLAIMNAIKTTSLARVDSSDDDHGNVVSDDTEEWESASSSSSSDSDDDADPAAEVSLVEVEEKRRAHFYGSVEWEPACVIDFADAKTGDPLYDLVAILFAALHCDRELWKHTLETDYWQAYIKSEKEAAGSSQRRRLRERFLQLVLLHPSRSIKGMLHYFPMAGSAKSWEELAEHVFGDLLG